MAGLINLRLLTDFFNKIGPSRHFAGLQNLVAVGGIVLQNSANERSTPKNGQYQNPKGRFLESKFPMRDLI